MKTEIVILRKLAQLKPHHSSNLETLVSLLHLPESTIEEDLKSLRDQGYVELIGAESKTDIQGNSGSIRHMIVTLLEQGRIRAELDESFGANPERINQP